jgi:hypothetical protein
LIVDAEYLALGVMQNYHHRSGGKGVVVHSYAESKDQLDAIYASQRLRLPFKGVLLSATSRSGSERCQRAQGCSGRGQRLNERALCPIRRGSDTACSNCRLRCERIRATTTPLRRPFGPDRFRMAIGSGGSEPRMGSG